MGDITVLNICTDILYCEQLQAYNLYQLKAWAFALSVFIALTALLFVFNYFLRIFLGGRKW